MRDEFLSEEDLDLKNLPPQERDALWTAWLKQAQRTNEQDRHLYTHGVFTHEPPWHAGPLPAPLDSRQQADTSPEL